MHVDGFHLKWQLACIDPTAISTGNVYNVATESLDDGPVLVNSATRQKIGSLSPTAEITVVGVSTMCNELTARGLTRPLVTLHGNEAANFVSPIGLSLLHIDWDTLPFQDRSHKSRLVLYDYQQIIYRLRHVAFSGDVVECLYMHQVDGEDALRRKDTSYDGQSINRRQTIARSPFFQDSTQYLTKLNIEDVYAYYIALSDKGDQSLLKREHHLPGTVQVSSLSLSLVKSCPLKITHM